MGTRGGSNVYPQSMFWAEIWKYQNFLSENFNFLVVKFSVYLNRLVFIIVGKGHTIRGDNSVRIVFLPFWRVVSLKRKKGLDQQGSKGNHKSCLPCWKWKKIYIYPEYKVPLTCLIFVYGQILQNTCCNLRICTLTLKGPITTAADNTFKYIYFFS